MKNENMFISVLRYAVEKELEPISYTEIYQLAFEKKYLTEEEFNEINSTKINISKEAEKKKAFLRRLLHECTYEAGFAHFTRVTTLESFFKYIEYLELKNEDFFVLGSCSGGSQLFSFILDGEGPKPGALLVFHPQEFYNTPFFVPALGLIPTFIMTIVQKMILFRKLN